jgi:hypothetical protein
MSQDELRAMKANVCYTLRNPLIADLLRVAREFLNDRLTESQSMLLELRRQGRRS